MSVRAYILLNVVHGKTTRVVRMLRDRPGVVMADIIEGPPDVIMVIEAHRRRKLAQLTIEALNSVENMTGDMQLLPVAANGRGYMPTIAPKAGKKTRTVRSVLLHEARTKSWETKSNVERKLERIGVTL